MDMETDQIGIMDFSTSSIATVLKPRDTSFQCPYFFFSPMPYLRLSQVWRELAREWRFWLAENLLMVPDGFRGIQKVFL